MPRFKVVEISELELEDILAADPAYIEDGMQILGRQFPTDSGPLDILAVDADKVLCIIELKKSQDEGHLDQGLRYYDWARMNLEAIARHHKDKVDIGQIPRLILVAGSFSSTMTRIAKYVDIPLDLVEYSCIQTESGESGIICRQIQVEEPAGTLTIPTDETNLKYIENERLRDLVRGHLDELRGLGIEIRPKANAWFAGWFKGKRFFYLGCKKQFFVLEVLRPDGTWSKRIRIANEPDYSKAINGELQPAFASLGGGILPTGKPG